MSHDEDTRLAIIGMSCRFPGANNAEAFWANLAGGVESISRFTRGELEASGEHEALLSDPRYVPARGVLDRAEWFDAGFFGFSPQEAIITDPQHRVFLESAYEALEQAGYDPTGCRGSVGVYAGCSQNSYLNALVADGARRGSVSDQQLQLGNAPDFLTTRVSYKLGLRGPSVTVQAACSTSLVAVHLAGQALVSGECDMALAGGVSVRFPQRIGYLYQPGGSGSPDGHCRAFDMQARGMVGADGVGVVVLKRLADALRDGDHVQAVIRGSAVTNDGAAKMSFAAPGIAGQAQVIRDAQLVAEVTPETVTYVEAHGTGTPDGDAIEVAALARAFAAGSEPHPGCLVGSVKPNIGHADAAAGMASLIKVVLALQHGLLPPTLHFTAANSKIDFACGPFMINTTLRKWSTEPGVRRAGVHTYGIGGTNAHVVLEEAPPGHGHWVRLPSRSWQRQRYFVDPPVRPRVQKAGSSAAASDVWSVPAEQRRPVDIDIRESLTVIFQEVLGFAAVGPHDDFFELGGDSLIAVHLIGVVCETFGVEVPLEGIFDAPTVSELAAFIEERLGRSPAPR